MAQPYGRRAPNVSQYIANLNTIPSPSDMAPQQDLINFDDDLAMFTNTQFFDFDMNENVPDLPTDMGFDATRQGQPQKNMPFLNQQNFNYNDFNFLQQQAQHSRAMSHASSAPRSLPPSPPNGIPLANAGQQSQPTLPTAFHFAGQVNPGPNTGDKRKSTVSSIPSTADLEEASRNAAEEDKRRRNTAASARFRVKKKQREAALEKTAKEMSDKVAVLEARVGQLEMENQWLKGLITEKNVTVDVSNGPPKAMVDAVRKAHDEQRAAAKAAAAAAEEEEDDFDVGLDDKIEAKESSLGDKKRGVGTEAAAVEV